MKTNNEITLKIKGDIEKFKDELIQKGYTETEHYILHDIFMIPSHLNIEELSTRDIISQAIIIREVDDIGKNEVRRDVSYKFKEFNAKGEIVKQTSTRLKILNCNEAVTFFQTIGYKSIMFITEKDHEYQKDNLTITTKDILNGDKLIEVETQENNKELNTIDKLKETLKKQKFPLDFSDCFIKKAEVELNKVLKRK